MLGVEGRRPKHPAEKTRKASRRGVKGNSFERGAGSSMRGMAMFTGKAFRKGGRLRKSGPRPLPNRGAAGKGTLAQSPNSFEEGGSDLF